MPEQESPFKEQERELPSQEQREQVFRNITLPMVFPELTGWDLKLTALFLQKFRSELQNLGIPDVQMEYVLGNRLLKREESLDDLEKYLKGYVRAVHCAIPRAEMEPTLASKLKHNLTSPHTLFFPSWGAQGTLTNKGRLGAGLEAAQRMGAYIIVVHAAEFAHPLKDEKNPEEHVHALIDALSDARGKIAPEVTVSVETQGSEIAHFPREKFKFVYNPSNLAELLGDAQKQNIGLTFDFQHCRIQGLDPARVLMQIHEQYPGLVQHAHINAPSPHFEDAHQSFAETADPELKHQLQQFLFALADTDFNGGLVPEVDPHGTVATHIRNLVRRKIIYPARGTPYDVRTHGFEEERQYLQDIIVEIHSLLEL
ncbi:MAG: TIM barrel protein [Patescibacteria group bacterium]